MQPLLIIIYIVAVSSGLVFLINANIWFYSLPKEERKRMDREAEWM